MSYRSLNTKPLNASLTALLKRSGHIGLGLGALTPVLALANPTGGTVIAGSATITNPNANGTVVKETSAAAIIDWQQFNIGKGQYVQFLQPSSSSIILNRVIGGAGSSIYGSLTGNGQIFLVNTNGVFFGKGSSIDAQGFLASTLDISDTDFLARNFVFDKSGSDASVINQGSITAHKGGYVVLAGDYTENDGVIAAQSGHIILASGTKSTLTLNGNSLVSYAVDQATLAQLAGVANAGKLEADGGTVIMTADVANLLKATVVNNTGLIEATSLSNQNGVIQLLATGGNIQNAGTLDVDATQAGQQGGSITLKGDQKTILTDTSKITATGDGADGGRVEVSGDTLSMRGSLTLGKGGRLLLDPTSVEIVAGVHGSSNAHGTGSGENGSVGVTFIENQLNAGANVAISAHNLIYATGGVDAINATGKGNLNFKTAAGGDVDLGGVDITIGGKFIASMDNGSFGHLQAGSIDLHATGDITLTRGASNAGKITAYSAKATTGNLDITAAGIATAGSAEFGLALDAVKGSIAVAAAVSLPSSERLVAGKSLDVEGNTNLSGAFTAVASDGYAHFGNISAGDIDITATVPAKASNNVTVGHLQAAGDIILKDTGGDIQEDGTGAIFAGGSISFTANHIKDTGGAPLDITTTGGNITLKGIIGVSTTAGLSDQLFLRGKHIRVNHNIKAVGVSISGSQLSYTGAGNTLAISAGLLGLDLKAAIGTALAPVKYDVKLTDDGRDLYVGRSIYTGNTTGKSKAAASITATEVETAVGGSTRGLIVGGSGSAVVTLSAKGSIDLTGEAVGIDAAVGFTAPAHGFGPTIIKAGKGVSITATGHGSASQAGDVEIHGGQVHAGDSTLDRSVLIQGANIDLSAKQDISAHGGSAFIHVQDSTGAILTGNASLTLKATGNLTMTAGSDLFLSGGTAQARIDGSDTGHREAQATSGLDITSGKAMTLSGKKIQLYGGGASAAGVALAGESYEALASAGIDLKVGTTLTATAVDELSFTGGSFVGKHGSAQALGAHATMVAGAHADVAVDAGTLKLKGAVVNLTAGNHVLDSHNPATPSLLASGSEAAVFVGYSADLDISVGAGGASIVAVTTARLVGGTGQGQSIALKASGPGAELDADVRASVNIGGAGPVGIKANSVTLSGGVAAGSKAVLAASGAKTSVDMQLDGQVKIVTSGALSITGATLKIAGGGSAENSADVKTVSGAVADLSAKSGIVLQGTAVSLTATAGALSIQGGGKTAYEAKASAGTLATATVTGSAGIALAATKGNLTVKGAGPVLIAGGASVAAGAGFASSQSTRQISGSHYLKITRVFDKAAVAKAAGFGANATLDGSAGVKLSATGNVALSQSHSHGMSIRGGDFTGNNGSASAADGGDTKFSAFSGVSVKAGGNVSMTGLGIKLQSGRGQGGGFLTSVHSTAICTGPGACTSSALQSIEATRKGVTATGAHAKALGSIDAGISVQGANVTLAAAKLDLSGGSEDGAAAGVIAHQGGSALGIYRDDLSFAATKALTMKATTSFQVMGGLSAGDDAEVMASGLAAAASLQLDQQLSITAGSVSLTDSHAIRFDDAGASFGSGTLRDVQLQADAGGAAQLHAGLGIQVQATGAFTAKASDIAWSFSHSVGHLMQTSAAGGKVSADIQDSIGISAKTLQLTAGNITLSGMRNAMSLAHTKASAGGSVDLKMQVGVDLTAATAFGAIATGNLSIAAGAGAFFEASMQAKTGGKAGIDVDTGIVIDVTQKSGALTLQASTLDLGFIGTRGGSAAKNASVRAQSDGSAHLAVNGDVELTALGAVKLTGTTGLSLQGASFTAFELDVSAHGAGAGAFADVEGSLDVTGASVTLTSGRTLSVMAGSGLATHMFMALASGGSVTATVDGHVDLKATTGALTLTGGAATGTADAIKVAGGSGVGDNMSIDLDNGKLSQGHYSLDAGVTLEGATGISLAADRILMDSSVPSAAGALKHTLIDADQGQVYVDAHIGVDVVTQGTFTAKATEQLLLAGYDARVGSAGGVSHAVNATSGGVTAVTVDGALDITAQNVALTGVDGITVMGGRQAGKGAAVHAGISASASMQIDDGVSIQASKAITISAGPSHSVLILGGRSAARSAQLASFEGKVSLYAESNVSLQAASLTITAGSGVTLAGGGAVAAGAHVDGGFSGGSGVLTARAGVNVNVSGAFSVKAGANIFFTANSSGLVGTLGRNAVVGDVSHGHNAIASMILGDAVDLNVGTATLKASGSVALIGNRDTALSGSVSARQKSAVTSFTADGRVDLDAKGAITITTPGIVTFSGGASGGDLHVGVHEAHDQVDVSLDDGVGVTAGGALSVKAGSITIRGGGRLGAGMSLLAGSSHASAASGRASAAVQIDADVKVQAASISMTAVVALTIAGESSAGDSVHITAINGAKGVVTISGTTSLKATGAMNLAASVFSLHGGSGATFQGPQLEANSHGIASYQQQAGVSLTAATISLTGAGSFIIAGGDHVKGSMNADGGSAVMQLHDGVAINAASTLSMTAGSNLVIHGGSDLTVLEQVGNHAGGTSNAGAVPAGAGAGNVSAAADVSVGIQAGTDITIKAAKAVDLQAGTKVLLALGAYAQADSSGHTSFFGHAWAGGSAALDADAGISIQAGRNLAVTAGSGNLDLAGLRGSSSHAANRITTRGGSSHAVADVKLAANAVLSAGSDLTLNVKGAAIVAGGTASDVSDQGKGDLDMTVSDGAQMHAGHDVVLNSVTGGLVVTGAHTLNVLGVDSLGADIVVKVQGDASISAGHDIRTVKTLGGDVTVQGGTLHFAGLDGSASGAISVTAQAGLRAGASISLVETGNFTVTGGFGTMSIGAHTQGRGRGVLDVDADVTAPGALDITADHIGVIGGDVRMSALDLGGDVQLSAVGSANVDVSVGTLAMTVTAGGSLGFLGGGDGGGAFTEFVHAGSQASLSASAENSVDVEVLHNATIKTTAGNASFMGGFADKAGGLISGDQDTALSTSEGNVTLDVGGNLSLTIDGNLKVQGGEGAEQDGSTKVTGSGDDVQAQIDSRVDIIAAGDLTLATSTKSNFQITVQGGDSAGGGFRISTGPSSAAHLDTLVLDVDTGVSLTAGGALSITGTLPVKLEAGKFAVLASGSASNGVPAVALISDVVLTGKTVSFSKNISPIITGSGTRVTGGVVQQGTVTVTTAAPTVAFSPLSLAGLGTLQAQGIVVNLETLLAVPAPKLGEGVSFMPNSAPAQVAFPRSCDASLLNDRRSCAPASR